MKKILTIFYDGLKINITCLNEELYNEQYKMYRDFFVDEKTPYTQEVNVFYSKNQKIVDRLNSEIQNDKDHFTINPFGNTIYNVQNKQSHVRFMAKDRNSISIKQNNGNYAIVGSETTNTKYAPYILILEIISRYNEINGRSIFHSTAFKLNNKGILVIGESGSGKTTFLSKLIDAKQEISFLSNDRAYVGDGKIYYFPLEIILSMGTVKHSDNLSRYFIEKKITDSWLHKELSKTANNEKCGIKPKTFCEVNNIGYSASSNLSLIIFPQVDHVNKDNIQVKTLEYPEVVERLRASCYTPNDKESHRDMWIEKGVLTNEELEYLAHKNITNMAKTQLCLSCQYGENATGEQILGSIYREILNKKELTCEK